MKIIGIVIALHALFLVLLFVIQKHIETPIHHKLVIETFQEVTPIDLNTHLVHQEQPKIDRPEKTIVEKKSPERQISPVEQRDPKSKNSSKSDLTKVSTETKSNKKKAQLVGMIQKSLSTLNQKPSDEIILIKANKIGRLSSEKINLESTYTDQLIGFLENALELPEKGKIKLQLTVKKNGHVKALTIQETNSLKNQKYVEEVLPILLLPPFDKYFEDNLDHTFSIILTSS
ncbi:MAG: hypothetical protein R3E91_04200 [Chlamydiales bacterium]